MHLLTTLLTPVNHLVIVSHPGLTFHTSIIIIIPTSCIVYIAGARNAQMFQADVQQFANLVTAHIPPERMPGSSPVQRKGAQDKLVDCVCRDMLRMETETSATEYMENVKQVLHRRCPSILCADNGAMVQSSGIVGGDASHRAPQLTSQLSSCFGQLPREQTLEYKFSSTAVELLQQVADLRPGLRHAQVCCTWLATIQDAIRNLFACDPDELLTGLLALQRPMYLQLHTHSDDMSIRSHCVVCWCRWRATQPQAI